MGFENFFQENGIFIILPMFAAGIKIIHDLLPTYVFLGLGFISLGVYVAVNQMNMDQYESSESADKEAIIAELEKSARKAEAKKNRQLLMKERQRREKAQAKERKNAQAVKSKTQSKILITEDDDTFLSNSNANASNANKKKVVVSANDSDDEGDNDLIRYAALQKKK